MGGDDSKRSYIFRYLYSDIGRYRGLTFVVFSPDESYLMHPTRVSKKIMVKTRDLANIKRGSPALLGQRCYCSLTNSNLNTVLHLMSLPVSTDVEVLVWTWKV